MKEAAYKSLFSVCMPPFVTKVRCSFEVRKMISPMIRNMFMVCCNSVEGICSPAKGHVEAGDVVVVSIFYLSIY